MLAFEDGSEVSPTRALPRSGRMTTGNEADTPPHREGGDLVDAHDPIRLSAFWSAVLQRPVSEGANDHVATIERTAFEPALLFLRVPEDKVAKNRLHLDLDCDELESARRSLEGRGATFVHERDEYA